MAEQPITQAEIDAVFPKVAETMADALGCDVEDIKTVDSLFGEIKKKWGTMDFLVHAIAFSDKAELKGRYADTSRDNFSRTMLISCYSFTEVARMAAELMPKGGALLTLTYDGSQRVMPNYNVMGVAKAALESVNRYLARDLGPSAIRANLVSAGPVHTAAASGISLVWASAARQRTQSWSSRTCCGQEQRSRKSSRTLPSSVW